MLLEEVGAGPSPRSYNPAEIQTWDMKLQLCDFHGVARWRVLGDRTEGPLQSQTWNALQ